VERWIGYQVEQPSSLREDLRESTSRKSIIGRERAERKGEEVG